ncbi:hypothetical protein EJK54_0259 [Moraxella catarrhalis]|uniref:Uncharacterized protein n=1 Tax=Moraxella catarrhalis TaxID=480 RepID=A0ABY0BI84_MORCA|nr:hypothetical protein EJK48_0655 [Moraxella catarrhalis]RUO13493.1 hypothetical protein EJK54_0259 [Moraxella catarrhalis]RUO14710.1 hypothetical protein EJK49_1856 [Moraxella catarrhalis]
MQKNDKNLSSLGKIISSHDYLYNNHSNNKQVKLHIFM